MMIPILHKTLPSQPFSRAVFTAISSVKKSDNQLHFQHVIDTTYVCLLHNQECSNVYTTDCFEHLTQMQMLPTIALGARAEPKAQAEYDLPFKAPIGWAFGHPAHLSDMLASIDDYRQFTAHCSTQLYRAKFIALLALLQAANGSLVKLLKTIFSTCMCQEVELCYYFQGWRDTGKKKIKTSIKTQKVVAE